MIFYTFLKLDSQNRHSVNSELLIAELEKLSFKTYEWNAIHLRVTSFQYKHSRKFGVNSLKITAVQTFQQLLFLPEQIKWVTFSSFIL